MDLNEILEGMSNDNCGNSGYCNTSGCGNSFDNCGQSVGGVNNFNGFGNNSCSGFGNNCGGFGNNCGGFGNNCGFGFGGGIWTLIWLFLLCGGGFGGNGGFGGCGNRCCCCCEDECCCGCGNGGFGCNAIIWIIILATLCGGFGNNCGNNNCNGLLGNCGC